MAGRGYKRQSDAELAPQRRKHARSADAGSANRQDSGRDNRIDESQGEKEQPVDSIRQQVAATDRMGTTDPERLDRPMPDGMPSAHTCNEEEQVDETDYSDEDDEVGITGDEGCRGAHTSVDMGPSSPARAPRETLPDASYMERQRILLEGLS
ncbi:hypothetical protein VE02_08911 [Pseudogymnoascus sp. 03VT05]|nr:hypothetical protein VE02_08911 [Pseudogymnoascus sp. 03VT05]